MPLDGSACIDGGRIAAIGIRQSSSNGVVKQGHQLSILLRVAHELTIKIVCRNVSKQNLTFVWTFSYVTVFFILMISNFLILDKFLCTSLQTYLQSHSFMQVINILLLQIPQSCPHHLKWLCDTQNYNELINLGQLVKTCCRIFISKGPQSQ